MGVTPSRRVHPMARPRLPIVPHLSHDEIARRYRACRQGIEKTHRQVLRPPTRPEEPPTPAQVAVQVGPTPGEVAAPLQRWKADGSDRLALRCAATGG